VTTSTLILLPSPSESPHPARSILTGRKLTVTQLGAAIGYGRNHTCRVLYKHELATAVFRARVSAVLNLPEAALFDRAWCK
jgi:hypothetical protein